MEVRDAGTPARDDIHRNLLGLQHHVLQLSRAVDQVTQSGLLIADSQPPAQGPLTRVAIYNQHFERWEHRKGVTQIQNRDRLPFLRIWTCHRYAAEGFLSP